MVLLAVVSHPKTSGCAEPWSWGRAALLGLRLRPAFVLVPQIRGHVRRISLGVQGDVILGLLTSLARVLLTLHRGP